LVLSAVLVAAVGLACARRVDTSAHVKTGAESAAAPAGSTAAAEQVTMAFIVWLDGANPDLSATAVERGEELRATFEEARKVIPFADRYSGRVSSVKFLDADTASVTYSIFANRVLVRPDLEGQATLVDGEWKVSRDTACAALEPSGVKCPSTTTGTTTSSTTSTTAPTSTTTTITPVTSTTTTPTAPRPGDN
jgi:hypothetical protein